MYTNVVFSGGGLACLSSFACANALRHRISGANTIVGTSAGSLVAALIAMDADEASVYSKFIEALGSTKPVDHVKVGNMFEAFGSMRSELVTVPIITKVFMEAYNMAEICSGRDPSHEPPTFREFARVTGKNLVISAVNVTKSKTVFFSVDTHPDQDVVLAIAASCAVPILLSPVRIGGDLFVDAGLTDNLPVAALNDNSLPRQTLAIDTIPEEAPDNEVVDIFSYFRATLLTVVKECNARNRRALDCDRISLETGHKASIHVDSFLGTVDQATIDSLYTIGIAAAREFEEGTSARWQKTTEPEHK
jgi:NTE family protein